jgi:hypothetical protein
MGVSPGNSISMTTSNRRSGVGRSDRFPPDSPHWRNAQARKLELQGKIDEAVELYELNVRDGFVGVFPYNRLRIIYVQRNELASAIRVCQAAIKALEGEPRYAERFQNIQARLLKRARQCMAELGIGMAT